MPYTERMAEAFLQAKEQQGQQEPQQQEPQGVPVQGTAPGVQGEVNWPKYRKPTEAEAVRHIAHTKALTTIAAGTLGLAAGGIPGTIAGFGAKATGEGFAPEIESHIRNSEWVPVYDNWTENDFHNEYGGR